MKFFLMILSFLFFINIINGQKNSGPKFSEISKSGFSFGTPIEDSSLLVYNCITCLPYIVYAKNLNNFSEFFVINRDTFKINELLESEGMNFFNVYYKSKRYLFISSTDFSASGKAYTAYRDYYLFELNNKNIVTKFKKLAICKLKKEVAFLRILSKMNIKKHKK